MEDNDSVSRRSFMKSVGAGAAGLTIAGSGIQSVFAAPPGEYGLVKWNEDK